MHGHKDSYADLNLKILTSDWDSNPRLAADQPRGPVEAAGDTPSMLESAAAAGPGRSGR